MRILKALLALVLFLGVLGYCFYFYYVEMNFFALLAGLLVTVVGVFVWWLIERRKKKSY